MKRGLAYGALGVMFLGGCRLVAIPPPAPDPVPPVPPTYTVVTATGTMAETVPTIGDALGWNGGGTIILDVGVPDAVAENPDWATGREAILETLNARSARCVAWVNVPHINATADAIDADLTALEAGQPGAFFTDERVQPLHVADWASYVETHPYAVEADGVTPTTDGAAALEALEVRTVETCGG